MIYNQIRVLTSLLATEIFLRRNLVLGLTKEIIAEISVFHTNPFREQTARRYFGAGHDRYHMRD